MSRAATGTNLFCVFAVLLLPVVLQALDVRVTGAVNQDDRYEVEIILEEAEKRFLPRFRLQNTGRLTVHVCGDLQEFKRLTGVSWWNGGHFKIANRTIYVQRLKVLRERRIFKRTLVHEFLHYCVWRVAGRNCPLWLNEGLVLNLSGELAQLDCPAETRDTKGISFERLDKELASKYREKQKLAYCRSAYLVRDVRGKVGFEEVLRALVDLKTGHRLPDWGY
jgi:hypothetical protein